MGTEREFRIRYGSRLSYLLGAGLIAFEAVAVLVLMLIGVLATLIPILIVVFIVSPLWIWRFVRGDRLRLTVNELMSTGGKHGGSLRYEDIQEVRVRGYKVEIRLRQATGWWKRLNFGPGFRKFVLDEEPKLFLAELETRLGDVRQYSLPEGGVALVRGS